MKYAAFFFNTEKTKKEIVILFQNVIFSNLSFKNKKEYFLPQIEKFDQKGNISISHKCRLPYNAEIRNVIESYNKYQVRLNRKLLKLVDKKKKKSDIVPSKKEP